jgi:uncharacterized protein
MGVSQCVWAGENRAMPHPPRPRPAIRPLDESELDALQALLDAVPAPLEPLDVSMLDGFLCGVLVQPQPVPPARWLPYLTDAEGRALPPSFDAQRLHALARRRHAELDDAIAERRWFDPWVFELESDSDGSEEHPEDEPAGVRDAVYPWVGGFATALELFPGLMGLDEKALLEPLALLYQYLEPNDLEDADALLEEIETLEPPAELAEAVEDLVRATLLLADVSRPRPKAPRPSRPRRAPRR